MLSVPDFERERLAVEWPSLNVATRTDVPVSVTLEGNVGSTSRQAPLFLFFDACKERNVFKFCGSNHWLFFYRRLGLRT